MVSYNTNEMSSNCKVLYERGKFFIETGTPRSFSTWAQQVDKIKKYIPRSLIVKISKLIGSNDRDSATALWLKVCVSIDGAPIRLVKNTTFIILKLIIAGMAIYAFFNVVLG